jgi:hypothetical protein
MAEKQGFFKRLNERIEKSERELANMLKSPGESDEQAMEKLEMIKDAGSMAGSLKKLGKALPRLKGSYSQDPPVADLEKKIKLVEDAPKKYPKRQPVAKQYASTADDANPFLDRKFKNAAEEFAAQGGEAKDPSTRAIKRLQPEDFLGPRQATEIKSLPRTQLDYMPVAQEESLFRNLRKRFK